MTDDSLYERLSDPSDMATLREAQFLADAREAAAHSSRPVATGFCLYCASQLVSDEIVKELKAGKASPVGLPRWCDKDCRDAWDEEQRMKKISGRT